MKIGVISDTHGFLHPQVPLALDGVDMILHAGDVGGMDVLCSLEEIAPTHAVYGNMDGPDVMQETKLKAVIGVGGVIIGLAHGGGSPHDIITRLGFMFREDGVKVIVFGHTHCPMGEERDGIFFFNPGDGRKTVGILEIKEGVLFDSRIIEL